MSMSDTMSSMDEDAICSKGYPEREEVVHKRKLRKNQFPIRVIGQLWVDGVWQPAIPMELIWKHGIQYKDCVFNKWTKREYSYVCDENKKLRIVSVTKTKKVEMVDRVNELVTSLVKNNPELLEEWQSTGYQLKLTSLFKVRKPRVQEPEYLYFVKQQTEEEQIANPNLVGKEFQKHMKQKWKMLDRNTKEFWKNKMLCKKEVLSVYRSDLVTFANETKGVIEREHPDWNTSMVLAEIKRRWDERR